MGVRRPPIIGIVGGVGSGKSTVASIMRDEGCVVSDSDALAHAALRDPLRPGRPGEYSSGGPTDNVIDIYKAAAPAIDVIAPDIYMPEYEKYVRVLELYKRSDNALFVANTNSDTVSVTPLLTTDKAFETMLADAPA